MRAQAPGGPAAPPAPAPSKRLAPAEGRAIAPAPTGAAPDAAAPADTKPESDRDRQHVVLLSGLSGGGKTAAAKLFEDLGYTVVDNLPGELLPELAELVSDEPERYGKV